MKKLLIKRIDEKLWSEFTDHDLDYGTALSGDFAIQIVELLDWRDGHVMDFEYGHVFEVERVPGEEATVKRVNLA